MENLKATNAHDLAGIFENRYMLYAYALLSLKPGEVAPDLYSELLGYSGQKIVRTAFGLCLQNSYITIFSGTPTLGEKALIFLEDLYAVIGHFEEKLRKTSEGDALECRISGEHFRLSEESVLRAAETYFKKIKPAIECDCKQKTDDAVLGDFYFIAMAFSNFLKRRTILKELYSSLNELCRSEFLNEKHADALFKSISGENVSVYIESLSDDAIESADKTAIKLFDSFICSQRKRGMSREEADLWLSQIMS